ncbi:MAG: DUF123 domain-containing protein, partial [Promethearchaeota archaeon]
EKKKRWHVDYISSEIPVIEIFYAETNDKKECEISSFINNCDDYSVPLKKFGSSDCKTCPSHFYKFKGPCNIEKVNCLINESFKHANLTPKKQVLMS